jgi:16S rRNA (cytidine1402-2'-O)-methyltransferase
VCDDADVSGTLWIVGTPIGNLGDISERAREVLAAVDVVAAEDTRRAGRLLAHLGIDARLRSFFEGNEARRTAELLRVLRDGRDVAVVSDAGMPGISDPGGRVVAACIEAGINVRVVPGPSALTAALAVSGLPAERFVFEGFLPRRAGARRSRLKVLAEEPRTVVLFESPRRAAASLEEIADAFGSDRRVAVVRELTKLHEEVIRGPAGRVTARLRKQPPKGEVVIVVEGMPEAPADVEAAVGLARTLARQGKRRREAAAEAARRFGASANEVYRRMLAD